MLKRAILPVVLFAALLAVSTGVVILWNQVGDLQTKLSAAHKQIEAFRKREADARRIDTASKRDVWLLPNGLRAALGELTRPKKYSKGEMKGLWDTSYTPRKGKTFDVAYVEWRLSGRTKRVGGEELGEVLWVATVISSSKALGFDMSIDLEFLDSRGFRVAQDSAKGYVFPMEEGDDLPHETRLRGSLWIPIPLAKEIKEVTGTWQGTPRF